MNNEVLDVLEDVDELVFGNKVFLVEQVSELLFDVFQITLVMPMMQTLLAHQVNQVFYRVEFGRIPGQIVKDYL